MTCADHRSAASLLGLLDNRSGIAFDFDGVLADTCPIRAKSWCLSLEKLRLRRDLPPSIIGWSDEEICRVLVEDRQAAERLLQVQRQTLERLLQDETPPLVAGVAEFIALARDRGIRLAVASNSSRTRIVSILDRHRLSSSFLAIAGARGVCAAKPAPEIYRLAVHALGLEPSAVIAVEDSVVGVRSARAAGLFTVAIRTAYATAALADAASVVIRSFGQWTSAIRSGTEARASQRMPEQAPEEGEDVASGER